jgi:flagellar biosynthetic protein FliO
MPFPALPLLTPTLVPLALADKAAGPIEGPDLWRYLAVSSAMVFLVIAVGWVMRRFVAASLRTRAATRSLRVIDVLPLGGRQKLAVVRVYDRTLVVGLGEKEVNLVAELESGSEPAAIVPARAATSTPVLAGVLGAFERLRTRVGEARPRPRAGAVEAARPEPATAKPKRAAVQAAAAAPAAPVANGRLGNGRGLLG